jgi:TonB-linked SusC/RagA family outer membrane protein
MKIKLMSLVLLLFFSSAVFAQQITVRGTVTESFGSETLPGASVKAKGSTQGTMTDIDGNYTLSVDPGATLVISYLGYVTQEIAVGKQTVINVTLVSDEQGLDEVVIVGAILKKSDLTGAVGSISAKVLEEKPVTNINQALQGRVAGVFVSNAAKPGDDSSIKIRGINTINTSTDPIYVVDGLVMDNFGGGFNSINLNDVASIEVLKDASATALYGSRASNGVILITTKKGKNGEGKINYDGWYGVQSYARVPETMDSRQLFDLRKEAAVNAFSTRHPGASDADLQAFINDRVMTPYDPNGGGGYVFAQYELDAYAGNENHDWLDAVTRTGTQQNHTLSFTGGDDKSTYYLSFGYSNHKGMVNNLSDTKYTGRINVERNIKPWLKVGTNTSFTRTESEIANDDGIFDKARGANPMLPVSDEIMVLNYGDFYDQNYFNPIRTLTIDHDRNRDRLISANFLNINPLKGLNIRTSFSADIWNESRFRYVPNDIQEAIRYGHNGETSHDRDHLLNWQWDTSIAYDTTFGNHRISALAGSSTTRTDRDYTSASGTGFGTNEFSYYNIGSSYKTDLRNVASDFTTATLQSYFVRANYNYANKYHLTGTARYDGSSKFAEGKRWGLFPSFSAAWNITEEDFMENQNIFDQMKLRMGYGLVGNQNIDNYAFLTLYSPQVDGDKVTYKPNGRRGNKDITWESQHQSNLGIDMAFLNNRIRFSADAFLITNKNLLMLRSLPLTSGYKEAIENIGAIENKGLEFTLDANIISTEDFQWNLSANISADKNKVTQLYGDNDAIYKIDDDRNLQKEGNLFIGESRNTIYIWRTGGIAQAIDMDRLNQIDWSGRNVNPGDLYPDDVDKNNVIDEKDRIIVGSPDPKFYGGFSTEFTYKGIGLNAVFSYSYGAKKLSPYYEALITSTGRGIASVDLLDRWRTDNTGAQFPRPIYNDPNDLNTQSYNTFSPTQMDFSVQDASFLRLSVLTLSYTLPGKIVNQLKLNNLRIYSTASNLFCLTPYKGYDPETGDWYPPTRMFVFGLNVSF